MTDKQINEIMALVREYGAACFWDCREGVLPTQSKTPPQAFLGIESALRAAVPAIPEGWKLVPSVPTTAMIDAGWDEAYARLNTYALTKLWGAMLSASPQAPQPEQPRKPLFEDLIAQHPGLSGELSAMDAQPDWTEQTR
jgi:hypothetical protein